MFTLITCWYHEPNMARRAELLYCLNRNLEHPLIKQVWLMVEGEPDIPQHPKIRVRYFKRRPLFIDMVKLANSLKGLAIIANTDIYFDDTLGMAKHLKSTQCYALTRWDARADGTLRFYNKEYSQDAWIVHAPLAFKGGAYSPGKPGCDNKFAWELAEVGLSVSNPSKTIKACHLHLTNLRRYTRSETVPGPYLTIQPTQL
nr:hypothetical protein [Cytophagales bacterium]